MKQKTNDSLRNLNCQDALHNIVLIIWNLANACTSVYKVLVIKLSDKQKEEINEYYIILH